ncbi:phosphoribosylanthranilate isomerase [Mucilaginibacter robiniae]|uniref:N-(5'-phosphoribosyl)anthranilate isomerase n=1 Tax=Mucilaginibacter robiniae TaxID=2728022 RepID=A0A7L5E2N7_9SPHI|nr:phosphoribosylanthranilate isomerase [Mucilaginibacter robiniae]QJD97630.1 phosphoribosylanthranilate isomerase [Mucilaginibacter robiniae]
MKIKVCGMKSPDNIKEVASLTPDYMGFICYDLSPRFIAALPSDVLEALPESIYKTAVFVNESVDKIRLLIQQFGFNAVQLHGNESPEFCNALRDQVTVFKAFGVDDQFDFSQLDAYMGYVDYFMFDTKTEGHGGSGKTFNWDILNNYHGEVPFFICGGLSLENIEKVKEIKHPAFYGVDLNSRFETEPGMKNTQQLREAFTLLRAN